MYKASFISISEDFIKDVNKLLYGFIWKGNDKIKRNALINDIENGGLKMLWYLGLVKILGIQGGKDGELKENGVDLEVSVICLILKRRGILQPT